MRKISNLLMLCVAFILFTAYGVNAQNAEKKKEILEGSKEAKAAFLEQDDTMAKFFNDSHGYVIFPNVGKGGFGVGGAAGNGTAYEKGNMIGYAKLSQVTVGFQAGGQAYREVIFFKTAKDLERFKENKVEFSAQVSAVAAAEGAASHAKYVEGVAVFTMQKKGLMFEASVGGQKFKFNPE